MYEYRYITYIHDTHWGRGIPNKYIFTHVVRIQFLNIRI